MKVREVVEICREGTNRGFKVENFSRAIVGYSPRLEFLACQFFFVSDRGSLYLDPRFLTKHPRSSSYRPSSVIFIACRCDTIRRRRLRRREPELEDRIGGGRGTTTAISFRWSVTRRSLEEISLVILRQILARRG